MNLDTATLITACVPSLLILIVGWVIKRIVRANGADSDVKVRAVVGESEDRIKAHVDRRVDELSRDVRRVDAAQRSTSQQVVWLYGHLGQTPPGGIPVPVPIDEPTGGS